MTTTSRAPISRPHTLSRRPPSITSGPGHGLARSHGNSSPLDINHARGPDPMMLPSGSRLASRHCGDAQRESRHSSAELRLFELCTGPNPCAWKHWNQIQLRARNAARSPISTPSTPAHETPPLTAGPPAVPLRNRAVRRDPWLHTFKRQAEKEGAGTKGAGRQKASRERLPSQSKSRTRRAFRTPFSYRHHLQRSAGLRHNVASQGC